MLFSCEFCEISKNNFLTEHRWTTASYNTIFISRDRQSHLI